MAGRGALRTHAHRGDRRSGADAAAHLMASVLAGRTCDPELAAARFSFSAALAAAWWRAALAGSAMLCAPARKPPVPKFLRPRSLRHQTQERAGRRCGPRRRNRDHRPRRHFDARSQADVPGAIHLERVAARAGRTRWSLPRVAWRGEAARGARDASRSPAGVDPLAWRGPLYLAPSPDALASAYRAWRGGMVPERPPIVLRAVSALDPSLAPPGAASVDADARRHSAYAV